MSNMALPLWLLDVDGVINGVGAGSKVEFEVCRVEGFSIAYRKPVVDFIVDVQKSGRCEVRWLTTWCGTANQSLAPALGLPICTVEGELLHRTYAGLGWWKSDAARFVVEQNPDRPLIWTDDDFMYARKIGEIDWLNDRDPGTYLAISPSTGYGLSDTDLERIDLFLQEHQ